VCRPGGGKGDPWGASDSFEDFGFASVVERFYVCLEKDSRFGGGWWEWLKHFPRVCEGKNSFVRDRYILRVRKITIFI
jgi:hypothetical protein